MHKRKFAHSLTVTNAADSCRSTMSCMIRTALRFVLKLLLRMCAVVLFVLQQRNAVCANIDRHSMCALCALFVC